MTSLFVCIRCFSIEILQKLVIGALRSFVDFTRESTGQSFQLFSGELSSLGHHYFELNYQIPSLFGFVEERHAKSLDHLLLAVPNDISRVCVKCVFVSIEVSDGEIESQECLDQSNIFLYEEIWSLASIDIVGILSQDYDQVTCCHVMEFVALSFNCYHVTCWSTRRNSNLEVCPFLDNFTALASLAFASLTEDISHPLTMIAVLLDLSVHSRSHLSHFSDGPFSPALGTNSHIASSLPLALFASSRPFLEVINSLSFAELLQSDIQSFLHGLHLRLLFFSSLLPSLSFHHLHNFWVIGVIRFCWDICRSYNFFCWGFDSTQ